MKGFGRFVVVTMVCALVLGAAASMHASSAAAADWQQQAQIEGSGARPDLPLLGISCPSAQLCVAVGELDTIVSSTNPTGGAASWHVAKPTGEADSDCHQSWVPPCRDPLERRIRGVSCPSAQLCVAVTGEGYVYSSTNPTGSGSDWRVADIDGTDRDTHLLGVSCPTASLCVAVSGERHTGGKVLTSSNPNGGAGAWTVTQLDPSLDLRGVSCGTPTLCVAVAEEGRMLVSTNPTGGPAAWTSLGTPGGPGAVQGISCAGTVLCVAGNAGGNLLASTSPGVASSWREANGGASVQVTGVSCLTSRQCIAVDNNGDVLTSNDATAGPGSWSMFRLIPYVHPPREGEEPLNGLFGASCASRSFCALVGIEGQVFTSTNPFAAPSGPAKRSRGKRRRGPKRPRVTIARLHLPTRRALREHRARVMVRFFANGPVRRFECRIKRRRYRPCRSPKHFRVGRKGTYAIRIRAVGRTGLRGRPAVKRFWIGTRCIRRTCFSPAGVLPMRPRGPRPRHARASAPVRPARTPLPPPRAGTADCDASAGRGAIRSGSARVGRLVLPGRNERSSHYSSSARRYSSKMPALVSGARPLTVRVPRRLQGRVRLIYGGSGLVTELTFEPCRRRTTFFPGGIVFLRQEPISLVIEADDLAGPQLLRLGRIRPR